MIRVYTRPYGKTIWRVYTQIGKRETLLGMIEKHQIVKKSLPTNQQKVWVYKSYTIHRRYLGQSFSLRLASNLFERHFK